MPEASKKLSVFLCHASGDKPAVRELYERLLAEGWIDPWLDARKILPGEDWREVIEKAVDAADNVIICLSNTSINKDGFVQKEMRYAREIALEKAEGAIFLIPLRLEDCEVPRGMRFLQWVDYFGENREQNYHDLLEALEVRYEQKQRLASAEQARHDEEKLRLQAEARARQELAERIEREAREKVAREMEARLRAEAEARARQEYETQQQVPQKAPARPILESLPKKGPAASPPPDCQTWGGIEFMRIPAGRFLMGSKEDNEQAWSDEKPQHEVDIPYDYWLARFPLTNAQYNEYVKAKGVEHPVSGWQKKTDHPVRYLSWKDAMDYCRWLDGLLKGKLPPGLTLRLPTEAEWEMAARGPDGREWPWGNTFDKAKCNTDEGRKGGTTPVGLYSPQGDSPYGCADMAGNVWEWTHSLYKFYPYKADDGREDEKASGRRVLRGGSFIDNDRLARCACRLVNLNLNVYTGVRVAASPISLKSS